MATGDDEEEITRKLQDISLNSDMGGCAGKSGDRMEKDKWLKENSKFPSHTAKVLRIRRVTSLNDVKEKKQAIEKNTNCSISLAKKEDEEPNYFKSWLSNNRNIVIAEGNVEDSVTDIIVCPIDEHCQPAGKSAESIFQKGGWTELEEAAKCSKMEHEKDHGTGDTNWLYSTSTTGSLNCRRIWFVYIKKLRDSMELLSKTLYDEVEKNYWRSIYFPVESHQIKDGTIQKMAETFLKPSEFKPLTGMEIVLCVSSGSRDSEQLDAICQEYLKCSRVISFYNETQSNVDEYIPCSCFPSPFEVKIEIESILDIAKEGKVDVIVNSTNQKLILKEGHVSSLILEHGGPQIQKECNDHGHINEGDIMVSNAGKLCCKMIIHCVLIDWISTGNLSLKVLLSLVKKCLEKMEKCRLTTIAFPALGTGKLGYPYIQVARTMQRAVYEYGISHPRTCIRKVIFALYKEDRECIQTFQDVLDSEQIVKDFTLNPTFQFLENRISKSGLLIQLMSQEINEPVDAVIKFTSSLKSSKYGHGEQGASGPVILTWCREKGCYTGTYIIGQDMKVLVEKCFTMLEFMKITSTRIDIRNIDATNGFETVMNSFCDNFTTAASRSTKTNTNKNQVRYLRKLQILARQAEIEKVQKSQQKKSAETDFTLLKKWHAFWNSGECEEKWKVVEKTRTKCVVCCVRGPTKDVVENAWEQLKIQVGAYIQGVGRWCFCQNYKWRLVSKICNIKLIEAEEKDMNEVDITDEDGITHTYNLDDLERIQKNPTGDVRKEKIQFIHGCETSPKTAMWAAYHNDKWIFLPMQCCQFLNNAAEKRKMNVTDSQNNVYDLNKMQRMLQNNGSNRTYEDILCIEAVGEKTKHFTESDVKIENDYEDDFSVFEIVTGVIMLSEEYGNDVLKIVKDSGCFVMKVDDNSSVQISGSLEGIEKVNLALTKKKGDRMRNSEEGTDYRYIVAIPMSKRNYEAVSYFGNKNTWFKTVSNNVKYDNGSLYIDDELTADFGQDIEKKLYDLFRDVQSMSSDNIQIPDDFKKDNVKKTIEGIEQMTPSVCLLWNENDIEIISGSYTEFLQAKGLLQQNLSGKANRRTGRTFTKEEKNQNLRLSESTVQDANSNDMSVSMNQSMRSSKVELKTKEGVRIKIYAGSITRLGVDCIVNAANENLMHGGGVAAAISDAAGYQFDQESRDYVQKYGPIPVGTCCVTSAGKLPYECVIHTVGPRWENYRDKSQCLQLLQNSVRVTFEEADIQKMKSIAIPAISSGIFSVPRDKCVEQYYEAAMSFSRNYPAKYLQEIHFVDRDESMVRAIQETFQSRSKSASTSEKTDKKNDTFAFNGEKTVYSNMPLSISFTTVNVSENLQIKIHIGNITDIVADAVVCPQDKGGLSDNDIARDIFGKIPDKQPSINLMKYGDVCSQKLQENSKWKMIIHAVPPVFDAEYAKNHSNFVKTLNTIIQKIIKTADEAKLHSIAIPLLGTGTEEYRTPVQTCASSFYKAVMANKSELMYLNDIYLVLKEEEHEKMYLEDFALINCKITQRPMTNNGKSDDFGKTMKEMPKEGENCCICMDTPTKPKKLRKCGHIFCKECIEQYFQYKPACPSCGTIYGKVTGDQPPGTMSIRTNGIRLQGFNDSSGTIVLTYFFNDGKQGDEHPDPGKVYKGINRSGYLPFNKKGRLIAKLLNVAFSRRLVFTIGRSRTTGHDGVITWNDIHHKTRMEGGPARFGYPDPTYLDRVLEELEAKGVTEESADDPEEYKEYSREIRY